MKMHRTDSVSLFFGVVFLLVAAGFLARRMLNVELPDLAWLIAGGVTVLGLIGVLGALVPSRKKDDSSVQTPVEPTSSEPAQD